MSPGTTRDTARERDYVPVMVYVDPASTLMSLRGQFPGVVIDPSGAGDHVLKMDIRIRRVKEMYHTVKAGLPWVLPHTRVKDLVTYCVSRINLHITSALHSTTSPRVLFTGTITGFGGLRGAVHRYRQHIERTFYSVYCVVPCGECYERVAILESAFW
jgi:hypothetical protein